MMLRQGELQQNLRAVNARIAKAAEAADRNPDDITLVVVTKTWPATDVLLLAELGVKNVGENRDQEAAAKYREVEDIDPELGRDLVWHFVGQLQTNKAKSVARYADVVHSVDRLRLVAPLARSAEAEGRMLACLVQVQLDGETEGADFTSDRSDGRGGAVGGDAAQIAAALTEAPQLRFAGVMGVAPLGQDPAPAFARLREVAIHLAAEHPDAKIISAGMSGDLEAAVAQGATHVRVGSAVLGGRPPVG